MGEVTLPAFVHKNPFCRERQKGKKKSRMMVVIESMPIKQRLVYTKLYLMRH